MPPAVTGPRPWPWDGIWEMVFRRHMQTPLMLPEAIICHLLTDVITGLSPHLHFQRKSGLQYKEDTIRSSDGGTVFQITLQELSPKLPSAPPSSRSPEEGRQAAGSHRPARAPGEPVFLGPVP